jgi:hypothetical protein
MQIQCWQYNDLFFFIIKQIFKISKFSDIIHITYSALLNPLTPNNIKRRRAVSPLKIKTSVNNLGRQRCAEEFNSGVKRLNLK